MKKSIIALLFLCSTPASAEVLFQRDWRLGGTPVISPMHFNFDAYALGFLNGIPVRWRISEVDSNDVGTTWVASAATAGDYPYHEFFCDCTRFLDWDEMVSTLLIGQAGSPNGPTLVLTAHNGGSGIQFRPVVLPGTTIDSLELKLNSLTFGQRPTGEPNYEARLTFRILGEGGFVPEPTTLFLAIAGLCWIYCRRSKSNPTT